MRAENGLIRVFRRNVLEHRCCGIPLDYFPLTRDADVRQQPAALPPAAGPIGPVTEDRKGGAMALDITLAVGDGARHMTCDELTLARGIPLASTRIVPRVISRNSTETPDCSGPGPAETVSYATKRMPAADGLEPGPGTEPTSVADGPGADPLTAIAIQTLSQAVEMLREDVQHERDRADRAEGQVEVERQLVKQVRKRVDGLLIELAEARTAAMISGCEAAVLRTQLATLTERRPWWRRRFT